ncbi:MAG: hypothetical protein AAF390_12370 [Pseudomonadota bacterium]
MRYAIPLVLALAACDVPVQEAVWVRPGTPAFQAEQALVACARDARIRFPESRGIATSPSVVVGTGIGHHGFDGGFFGGGVTVYDFDRNEPRRDASLGACMAQQGFDLATLPSCPRGTAVTPLEAQPFDLRGLCVSDGRISAPG